MPRDATTLAIFTTTDDAIQGLLGLHACINAAYELVPKDQLVKRLPKGQFRLTHEWARHYDPSKLVDAIEQFFEFVQCRTSLTSLVSIVEAAVERFISRLQVTRVGFGCLGGAEAGPHYLLGLIRRTQPVFLTTLLRSAPRPTRVDAAHTS